MPGLPRCCAQVKSKGGTTFYLGQLMIPWLMQPSQARSRTIVLIKPRRGCSCPGLEQPSSRTIIQVLESRSPRNPDNRRKDYTNPGNPTPKTPKNPDPDHPVPNNFYKSPRSKPDPPALEVHPQIRRYILSSTISRSS